MAALAEAEETGPKKTLKRGALLLEKKIQMLSAGFVPAGSEELAEPESTANPLTAELNVAQAWSVQS